MKRKIDWRNLKILEFWEEDNKEKLSWTRGTGTVLVGVACFIAIYSTMKDQAVDHGLVLELLGAGLGLKGWHKYQNVKKEKLKTEVA